MTLTPSNPCFSVSSFKAYDADLDSEITDYITINDVEQKITIETNDRNLVKQHTINLKAVILESNEELLQSTI